MTKTGIALSAPANYGKTTTILEAYERLIKNHKFIVKYNRDMGRDTIAVLQRGNAKVAITSAGDCGADLERHFEELKIKDCDVVVCPIRTRESTVRVFFSLDPPFDLICFRQIPQDDEKKQKARNSKMADRIIHEVMEALGLLKITLL